MVLYESFCLCSCSAKTVNEYRVGYFLLSSIPWKKFSAESRPLPTILKHYIVYYDLMTIIVNLSVPHVCKLWSVIELRKS